MSRLIGDWAGVNRMFRNFPKNVKKGTEIGLKAVALIYEGDIKKNIFGNTQLLGTLHGFTVKSKKSSEPLIDKGDLRNSVTHKVVGYEAVIGVLKKDKEEANVMDIQEHGRTITVTSKMRKYLHAKGLHLKGSTTEITIMPRPVFKIASERMRNQVSAISIISKEIFKQTTKR